MGRTTDDFSNEAETYIIDNELDLDSNKIAFDYIQQGFPGIISIEEYIKSTKEENDGIVDIDLDDFNLEENEYNRVRTYGSTFKGVLSIKEYEDQYIYIPSSSYCYLKCIEKIFNIKIEYNDFKKNESITKIRKVLNKKYGLKELPNIYKYFKSKWVQVNRNYLANNLTKLFEIKIRKNIFHVGIIKDEKSFMSNAEKFNKHIKENLKIIENTVLDNKYQRPINLIEVKEFKNNIFVYDIETYTDENNHLHPIGIGYQKVDFNFENLIFEDMDLNEKQELLNKSYKYNPNIFTGTECMMDFIKDLANNFDGEVLEFYAHYGGKFDSIFFKQLRDVKFISQIKNKGCLLSLKIKYQNTIIEFKDSYKFVSSSLNKFCESMKVRGKDDFDIKGKNKNFFEENIEWIKYLKQDIICLSYALLNFEHYLRTFGLSLTITYGLPGLSWRTLYFNCFRLRSDTFITTDPVTKKFILDSIYGGRVIPFKRNVEKKIICLDANSLYPSAMFMGEYPIGEYFIMKEDIDYYLKKKYLFIAEVELDGCNRKYPLIPNKFSNRKDYLTYPANKFRGVYTSIEIEDALAMGYKIDKFHKGIYWIRKDRIFKNYIEYIYNLRKITKDSVIKDILKLLMNSAYGKFLETIENTSIFTNEGNVKYEKCNKNKIGTNQIEVDINYEEELVNKPIHIASFILSYARRIMNEYMIKIGLENIFYTDTDSIYTDIESANKIKISNELGGMKNDYGDGMYIEKAIFLDIKRYWLKFNNNKEKVKFNGFNFSEGSICKDYLYDDRGEDFETLFTVLSNSNNNYNIFNEKLIRKNSSILVNAKEMKLHVDWTKRFNLIDNEFLPKDYINIQNNLDLNLSFRSYKYKEPDNFKLTRESLYYDFYSTNRNKDITIDRFKYNSNFILSGNKYLINCKNIYYEFHHLNPIFPPINLLEYNKILVHSKNNNEYGFELSDENIKKLLILIVQKENSFFLPQP